MTDPEEPTLTSYRQWALPILRALESLGGSGRPREVEDAVRVILAEHLNDLQWARVLRSNYVRWARLALKKAGLVGGETGTWEITPAGNVWLEQRREEPLETSWNIAELRPEEAGDLKAPLETVEVTDFEGYEIPILRLLKGGGRNKDELFENLEKTLRPSLLPGDTRVMERGRAVWHYRASWALTDLKKTGAVRNPTIGRWEITDAGRARLEQEEGSWSIEQFHGSRAKVRAESAAAGQPSQSIAPPAWPTAPWSMFEADFGEIAGVLQHRLRPDLTATPETPIARNVILYGPPGTGKTYVAKKVAVALTGDTEPGPDSRWRLVQFHPSYAYEDFVQGLRPALEEKELRYKLHQGPFLQLCKAAEADPDHFFVLIIDEINRGDPARIFGELLYGLEYRDEPIDLASGGSLVVPPNVVILGTMNSVDRSVALVDHALRRRFAFVRVDPSPEAVESARLGALLAQFNEWLVAELDVDHAVGHSVFLNAALANVPADQAIDRVWEHDVRPLLEEYFFGQPERMKSASNAWAKAKADSAEDEDGAATVGSDDRGAGSRSP